MSLISILLLLSCANEKASTYENKATTRDIAVKDFSEINLSSSACIHFKQGDTTSVKLSCDAGDMDKIIIQNDGNTLVVRHKNKKGFNMFDFSPTGDINVFVTSPNLRSITISGSGDFEAENNIDTDRMKIRISGSGCVNLNEIICNSTDIIITGSGKTDIGQLKCGAATTKITGSGGIDIEKMQTGSGLFIITGSGEININNAFINDAKCKITGSGDISISGKVKALKKQVSGSGEISINN